MYQTQTFNPAVRKQIIAMMKEKIRLMEEFLKTEHDVLNLYVSSTTEQWTADQSYQLMLISQHQQVLNLQLNHCIDNQHAVVEDLFLPESENGGLD